jgi:hypothetical protein
LQAIERLEHITRWTNIAELSSPATSSIEPDAVQMVIYQEGQEVKDAQISFQYQQQNGLWKSPTFKVKLKNTSNQELFCALLDLTDSYAVSLELLETGSVWLKPGEEDWANRGQDIHPTVPEELWKQGITQSQDILKLIVSTAEFDATLLRQNELDLPFFPEREPGRGRGTLNRLMKRVQSRELRTAPEKNSMTTGLPVKSILLLCAPRHNADFQTLRGVHICTSSYVSCISNNQVFIKVSHESVIFRR